MANETAIEPKEVVRFFINSIKEMASHLDVDLMPYDYERLARVYGEVRDLLQSNYPPRGMMKKHE